MLEALFEVYFRVLKTCTASPALQQSDAVDKAAEQPGSSNRPGSTAAQTGAAGVSSQQQQQAGSHKGKGGGGGIRQQGHDVLLVGAIAPGPGLPRDRMLKKAPLLYPVLEGLGRYAHLISVEYFNDLMAVFHEVMT
jgi:nucleolar complex protein 3